MKAEVVSVIAGYADSKDTLTELRLALAGAVMNRERLKSLGFQPICAYDGAEIFEMRPDLSRYGPGETRSLVRLWLSSKMHLRDIRVYKQTHECFRTRDEQLRGEIGRLCRQLTECVVEPPAGCPENEWSLMTSSYTLAEDRPEYTSAMRQGLLLKGLIRERFSNDSALVARAIMAAARFPQYCPSDEILASIANEAAKIGMFCEAAILMSEVLRRGQVEHAAYNLLGGALHIMGRKDCALYFFLQALEGDPSNTSYSDNLWLEARQMFPQTLREGKRDVLFHLAQRVIQQGFTGTNQDKAETMCALGLAYEAQEDIAEAERYYQQARDTFESCKPALASLNRLNWRDMDTRRSAFKDLIRTFPELPEECDTVDQVPVKFTAGDTHGTHWGAVTDNVEKYIKERLTVLVSEGQVRCATKLRPGSMSSSDTVFAYVTEYQESDHICAACVNTFDDNAEEKVVQFQSAYPVGVKGRINRLAVNRFLEWPENVEGQIECVTRTGRTVTFFDPYYIHDKQLIKHPCVCEFELCGFARKIGPAKEQTFEITRGPMLDLERKRILEENPDADPEDIESVTLHTSPEFSCLLQAGPYPDEGEFRAIADTVEWFPYRGMEMCKLGVRIGDPDEEDGIIQMDLFAGRHILGAYTPRPGDTVEGHLWLQGFLHSEEVGERCIRAANVPFWAQFLSDLPADAYWRGILRAPEFQNRALKLVCSGLSNSAQVTAVETVFDAVPCDPEMAITLKDGRILYVHVLGYDATEPGHESRIEAWKRMRSAYAEMCAATPPHFLAVGFEKMAEGYCLSYAGMDELTEELGSGLTYPTFVREPGKDVCPDDSI